MKIKIFIPFILFLVVVSGQAQSYMYVDTNAVRATYDISNIDSMSFNTSSDSIIIEELGESDILNLFRIDSISFDGDISDILIEIDASTGIVQYNLALIDNITFDFDSVGLLEDYDGNIYKTIKIGDQWWMAENLKVTHYRNGDAITHVSSSSSWNALASGAYCRYNNVDSNIAKYGLMYNGYAVDDSRNVAPPGWHVPTDDDWKQLEMYLGMSSSEADDTGWRGTDEGTKLKATSGWDNDGNGTDISGFSALPGGQRFYNGTFEFEGMMGFFWTSTEVVSNDFNYMHYMDRNHTDIWRATYTKRYGYSIRLVKD